MKKSKIINDEHDSNLERHFSWWCDELVKAGILIKYSRGREYIINNKELKINWKEEKELKTKIKIKDVNKTLINKKVYTNDFDLFWNFNETSNKFYTLLYNNIISEPHTKPFISQVLVQEGFNRNLTSVVEIKPHAFDGFNMTRLFKTNQAIMWEKYEIYVNQIDSIKLFEATFTPQKYFFTDTGRALRKIPFKVRTLEEYLKEK